MKKVLALALAIMLALSAAAVVWAEEEESDWVAFEPTNTNLIGNAGKFDAIDWFDGKYSRALLTILLCFDMERAFNNSSDPVLQAMGEDFGDALFDSTYVGLDTFILYVTYQYDDFTFHVGYTPFDGTASYLISDSITDFETEKLMSNTCEDGYYKNTLSSISSVIFDIKDALSNDQ